MQNDGYQQHKCLPPTTPDAEGPFYRPGAPEKQKLCAYPTLRLCGFVLDQKGEPVPGALIEVWHATQGGSYEVEGSDRRGLQFAGPGGHYLVLTDRPGPYDIAPGEQRAAHVHVKVSAPGFRTLTTALYFPDDPRHVHDAWFDVSRLVSPGHVRGLYLFDFVLQAADPAPPPPEPEPPPIPAGGKSWRGSSVVVAKESEEKPPPPVPPVGPATVTPRGRRRGAGGPPAIADLEGP